MGNTNHTGLLFHKKNTIPLETEPQRENWYHYSQLQIIININEKQDNSV
jgi:hypothetical protein